MTTYRNLLVKETWSEKFKCDVPDGGNLTRLAIARRREHRRFSRATRCTFLYSATAMCSCTLYPAWNEISIRLVGEKEKNEWEKCEFSCKRLRIYLFPWIYIHLPFFSPQHTNRIPISAGAESITTCNDTEPPSLLYSSHITSNRRSKWSNQIVSSIPYIREYFFNECFKSCFLIVIYSWLWIVWENVC